MMGVGHRSFYRARQCGNLQDIHGANLLRSTGQQRGDGDAAVLG